jgi:ATP-dependent RNA helicase DeaD
MINYIEKQVNEADFTAMDIAAAFLRQSLGGIEGTTSRYESSGSYDFGDTGAEEGMVRFFINIGKKQRVKPGDILGAVAGETGIPGNLVGAIDMYDKFTFVEVPREYGGAVLSAMKNAKIKGKSINVEPANNR